MGLSSLDAALSGLRVSQQQISVISNNVSNVNTLGYSRKTMSQQAQSLNGVTAGVLGGTIIRNVDLNLERDLWTQISSVNSLDVRASYLGKIEQFHGAPEAQLSVAAEISRLRDSFSSLSDLPEDRFLLSQVVNKAQTTANKINDLSNLILTSRNDAQDELRLSVDRANELLVQIADLNSKIRDNMNMGRTTALPEDQRDTAIKELAGLMDISFFKRGDGVLVVQTGEGVELVNTIAKKLSFTPTPLSASSYYPESAAGIYVVERNFTGDPATSTQAINITQRDVGGKMGGLLELRDKDFPQQMAQLDELAHKLATRFEAQGLRLFTDETGFVPPDTAPDPGPPAVPVSYVGFSQKIQVNEAIVNDNTLIRRGTYGDTDIQTGSNEVIRRVIEYTFGTTNYQEAYNSNPATQVDLLNTGGADLQTWLGLFSGNTVVAGRSTGAGVLDDPDGLGGNTSIDVLVASAAGALDDPNDEFTITFDQPGLVPAAASLTITVDLSAINAAVAGEQNAALKIVDYINQQIAAAAPDSRLAPQAVVTNSGQIALRGNANITIDASGANGMGQAGLNFLGLQEGTTLTGDDPYFDVVVGNAEPVRITIAPGDTVNDLVNKMRASVPNLAVDIDADGNLMMRPGENNTDYSNQSFGGDIKIIGGPFTTSGASYSDTAAPGTRASIDNGVNIASALFGTYTNNGGVITNASAINTISYGSDVTTTNTMSNSFRNNFLGPNANISTDVIGSTGLIDFSQKMVNQHASQIIRIQSAQTDEQALRDIIQTQFNNQSGVNLDEELSNLIVYQTAFSAAARVVNAVDEMFQELLNAF